MPNQANKSRSSQKVSTLKLATMQPTLLTRATVNYRTVEYKGKRSQVIKCGTISRETQGKKTSE